MFGKLVNTIVLIYIVIGSVGILTNTKVSSNYIGHQRGMWPIDPRSIYIYQQIKNQQPKTSRKMFWYNPHTPILFGKLHLSNNMRAMHILPRYIHTGNENRGLIGNTQRTSLLNAKNALLSVSSTKYNTADDTFPLPSTTKVTPSVNYFQSNDKRNYSEYLKVTPSTNYIPNNDKNNFSEYLKSEWTACSESKRNAHCFTGMSNNYQSEHIPNMADNILTITTTSLPYSNYITHTYFTLDDVIIPRTRDSFKYNLPSQKTLTTEPDPEARFIPTTEMPTTEIFNYDSRNIETTPVPSVQNTREIVESFIPIMETRIEEIKITTPIPEGTTETELELLDSLPNLTTTQSILLPEPEHPANSSKELCKNCRETFSSIINSTLGGLTLKSVKDMRIKLKETYQNNLRIFNNNATRKANTTNLIPPRSHLNRTQKKYRVRSSTKKPPMHTFPKVTESTKLNTKRNKTNSRIFVRRRVVETNSTVSNNNNEVKNVTKEISSIKQQRRPVSINTNRLPKKLEKGLNISNSSITRNNTKFPAVGSLVEKVSLGTESAIMTISSGGPKQLHRPILKHKSHHRNSNKINNLDYDNVVPPLPIEVYFKKANQN